MINTRLEILHAALRAAGFDALFVSDESNVRYLSGYTNHDAFLLLTADGKHFLLTDSRYDEQARSECPAFEVVLTQGAKGGMPRALADLCAQHGVAKLGFEPSLSYAEYQTIGGLLQETAWQPLPGLPEQQRIVKDAGEQALIAQAAAATDRVFEKLCGYICAGRTEREVEWHLLSLIREEGCLPSFDPIVVSGSRGSLPHGVASDKKIVAGELVTMDFGCKQDGYCADITRTVAVGNVSSLHRERYDLVLQANLLGISQVKAGKPACDVDRAVRDFLAEQGYGAYFGHGLGHGIGIDVHESPYLSPSCSTVLQPGHFVTVEPGIYLPEWGGIRIEDMVCVTEEGCRVLFTSPKELIVL